MGPSRADRGVVQFEGFEADLRAGELRRRGRLLKLEAKPFQVLAALLRRPGELVTREELRAELWAADTFVEFDHSLNTAVNKLRSTLGDSARDPKFIETLHRRGYRFIAPLAPEGIAKPPEPPKPAVLPRPPVPHFRTATVAAFSSLLGMLFGVFLTHRMLRLESEPVAYHPPPPPPEAPGFTAVPWEPAPAIAYDPPPPDEAPAAASTPWDLAAPRLIPIIGGALNGLVRQQLVWVDRQGQKIETVGRTSQGMMYPSLSPDERSVAVSVGNDVWVQGIRGESSMRLSQGRYRNVVPLWSPLGDQILYTKHSSGARNIFLRAADGSLDAFPLPGRSAGDGVVVFDWSRDGQYIVYRQEGRKTKADIGYLRRNGDGYEPFLFLATPSSEGEPKLSPDGRYIAYCSDESGRREVYVRSFPSGEGKVKVSSGGGAQPRWSRDGSELFYVYGSDLMSAPVSVSPELAVGAPAHVFRHEGLRCIWPSQQYDVSADGRRFLVVERVTPIQASVLFPLSPVSFR